MHHDHHTGHPYYSHESGEVSWDLPPEDLESNTEMRDSHGPQEWEMHLPIEGEAQLASGAEHGRIRPRRDYV